VTAKHITKHIIGTRNRQSGSVLVEFAFCVVPLMGCVLILMDVAWIIFAWGSIQEATREGVRYGVTGGVSGAGLTSAIQDVVAQYSVGFVNASNETSVVTVKYYSRSDLSTPLPTSTPLSGGEVVQVTVSGLSVGSFGPIFRSAAPVLLTATSSDVMESLPTSVTQ
jgi:Flp pilus assembly protein TadG